MMDQESQICSEPEIVKQGLRVTIQESTHLESVQQYAVTYQWIDFQNKPDLLDRPAPLMPANDFPSFRHIAIHLLRAEESLTELVIDCQNHKASGVVLVHTSNDLPAHGRNPPRCDDVKIPVVLVKREVGQSLLNDVQDTSKTVKIVIFRETPIQCLVPEYQIPDDHQAALAAQTSPVADTPDKNPGLFVTLRARPNRSRPRLTERFGLISKMKKLLYEKTGQPAVMCQDTSRFCGMFDLLDGYERRINDDGRGNMTKVKKKVTKACQHLTTCMEKNYAVDFPYHCLIVFRLRSQRTYRDMDAVVSYQDGCVSRLRTLTAHSMETVFEPFLGNKMMISWGDKQKTAIELLFSFFERVYQTHHCEGGCQSNRSIENLGVSLVTAELKLAVQLYLGHQINAELFWLSFIKELDRFKLSWSPELLNEIKEKIDLGPSMGLQPSVRFNCVNLAQFMQHYQLYSFEKIRETVLTLYKSLPIETTSWVDIVAMTKVHLLTIIHDEDKRRPLTWYSAAGDLIGFVKEGRELISAIFDLRNYGSASNKPTDTPSSDQVRCNFSRSVESEIGIWIELILKSPFLNIDHPKWADYVLMLKQGTTRELCDIIIQKVIDLVDNNLEQLSPVLFHDILSKLPSIPEETARKFFRCYKAKPSDRLNDQVWCVLFTVILERDWDSLKPDILLLLRHVSQVYKQATSVKFIVDLLILAQPQNCPLLLSGEENRLLARFKEFLVSFLRNARPRLRRLLQKVLGVLGPDGESPLRDALLDVYSQIVIPNSKDLLKWEWSASTSQFIGDLSNELCELGKKMDQSPLPDTGIRSRSCWRLLVKCCQHVPPSMFDLADPPRLMALADVLLAFPSCWPPPAPGASLAYIQTNSKALLMEDMKKYGEWYIAVQEWLHSVQQRINDDLITTSELKFFTQNYVEIKELYGAFMYSPFLLTRGNIEEVSSQFKAMAEGLTCCLIYHVPGSRKCVHLRDLLVSWGVQIDKSLFQLVDNCVTTVGCPQTEEETKLPSYLLSFKPNVHLLQAKSLHDQTSSWLIPIMDNKDFLFYFSAHESVLFKAYLKTELEKLTETFSCHDTSMMISREDQSGIPTSFFATDLVDSDAKSNKSSGYTLSLETFNEGLRSTHQCLKQLLDLTAVFQHVSVIGQDRFKDVDVEAEFTTMVKYPEFKQYNVESVRRSIGDMLGLVQYSSVIKTIVSACIQFQMTTCLSDHKFKRLQQLGEKLQDACYMNQLAIGDSSRLKAKIDRQLLDTPVDKLRLFDAIQQSDEFFKFVQENKFYTVGGKDSFFQQVGLITNQLQDQEYNETVLSHLRVAFQCIVPFTNPDVSFESLLEQLKETEVFNLVNWVHAVDTVNSNITTIKMWFSKAEGDTIENVTRDLQAILESGHYEFVLGLAATANREHKTSMTSGKCLFQLVYMQEMETAHQPTVGRQPSLVGRKGAMASLLSRDFPASEYHSVSEHVSGVERWCLGAAAGTQEQSPVASIQTEVVAVMSKKQQLAGEELDDFVRKLGFMQGECGDQQQSEIRKFLTINNMMQDMFGVCSQLHKLGHPKYSSTLLIYHVDDCITNVEKEVKRCRLDLEVWQGKISDLKKAYKELLFFSVQRILVLAEAFRSGDLTEATTIVSALFSNSQESLDVVSDSVSHCYTDMQVNAPTSADNPFELCGKFLEVLVSDHNAANYLYPKRRMMAEIPMAEIPMPEGHIVHGAHKFSPDQVFRLLLQIYQGLPESFEVMRCTSITSREELDLFLQRAVVFQYRTFVMVNVDRLSTNLQEQVLRFQLDSLTSESVRMHYIISGHSIFHTAPWVKIVQYKDHDPELNSQEAVTVCKSLILKANRIEKVQLVYGRAGDGKSHYIKKQMESVQGGKCTIAVHEAFSISGAIRKLQQMTVQQQSNCVYFNVTVSPPSDPQSVQAQQYEALMDNFRWFLFDLFGLGFVQDPSTGYSFRLRIGGGWRVYVEIPSTTGHDEAQTALVSFQDHVPCLRYICTEHHNTANDPLDVDNDTQLVCKYLKALEHKNRINKLYLTGKGVKFSLDLDLDVDECHQLLVSKMGDHVKSRKIGQQLFVKYMKRRCDVLENAPGFTYNRGKGEYVNDRITGAKRPTNTKELGSTLLTAMLKEVNSFCHPEIQEDWKRHAHHQLVYDFKSGSASFLFLSRNPESLNRNEWEKLDKIGFEIPSLEELNRRELLDKYLSSALNVDLEQVPASSERERKYRLSAVDEEKYVLTVDYAVKMLDIHERRMCGVPVVIEGETGVGKTALVRMLSLLWNGSLKRSHRIALERILEVLKHASAGLRPDVDAAFRVAHCIRNNEKPVETDINKVCTVYWQEIRSVLFDADAKPSFCLLDIDKALVAQGKTVDSSDAIAKLLYAFLTAKSLDTFHKLSVHAALTPEDIINLFSPKFQQAKELLQLTAEHGEEQPPTVVIFLDEINTSSCMGLFKELLVDRSLNGTPIPTNVFLVAACNPHRGSSVPIRSSSERDDWILGSYYVRPVPPTLRFLTWDYGALSDSQEFAYIQEKISMDRGGEGDGENMQVVQHTSLIAHCQCMIREFALEQLKQVGFEADEADLRARSCVSQRDIQRVFTLTAYFKSSLKKDRPSLASDDIDRRAVLVSLGIVYFLRLDDKYRKEFCTQLKSLEAGTSKDSFAEVFTSEMNFYVEKMHIPVGIAKTRTLKENLFASVICTACRLPLIIVGAPGSSKTLSFNLALANLKGAESRHNFFRDTSRFPALDPYHYQCSRRSTSLEIENVFKRAIKQQQKHNISKLPINCVVFMDEAGLPEESHESLKVLHYYLDDPCISFVAITNHILDAGKSNRAVSLFRPKAKEEDLKTLAQGCLWTGPPNPFPELHNIANGIDELCSAYVTVMEDERFEKFFGLRDFIHFIGYIRRHRGSSTDLTPELVLKALERNFNGVDAESFKSIANCFLSKIGHSLASLKPRNTIEVLRESLSDLSLAQSGDSDGVESEVRYKLIIDTSEDDSVTRLLFMHGVLDQSLTRTFTCSDFPDDGDIQKVHIISAIKHAAMEGKTVILRQTDDINESFYDLFNQHFRRIDDPNFEGGKRYYANIAIGSHSKPCRVDPKFQCIMHMRQSEIKDAPAPFLNRFEKFLVSQDDLLQIALDALPPCANKVISAALDKGKSFFEILGKENMYGATEHTLQSLFLELLPPPRRSENNLKQRLVTIIQKQSEAEDCQDNSDEEDSYGVIEEELWNQQAPKIISALEGALTDLLGFRFLIRSTKERRFQTKAIFSAVLKLFDENDGTACRHQLLGDYKRISLWLAEGLLHLELSQATDSCQLSQYEQSVTTRNASFAVATFVQWTVFHVCSRILKITTPECLILKRGQIPQQYVLEYLYQQSHFSLKEVVFQAKEMSYMHSSTQGTAVTKVICFTRTTSIVHRLPLSYPPSVLPSPDSNTTEIVEQLLPDELTSGKLVMLKLESVRTLEAFTNILQEFMENSSNYLFLVIANMQNCSQRRVNHVRAMIEERELSQPNSTGVKKCFIILLHFPPSLGLTKPCYPTLFLHGWEYIYLDSIYTEEQMNPVDVCQWMRRSCAMVGGRNRTDDSLTSKLLEDFPMQLREGLIRLLPHAVNVAVSRIRFGDGIKCYLNRRMDARKRTDILLQLMRENPVLSEVLCEKFAGVWDLDAVVKQLSIAAHTPLEQESCLTVSERIQSRFRTMFYNYVSLSLFQLNKELNLEILFQPFDSDCEETAVKDLFVKIFKTLPIPMINELRLQNHTLDARQSVSCARQCPVFPFFSLVAQEIEQALDNILIDINKEVATSFGVVPSEDIMTGKQDEMKDVRLNEIENKAADKLLQLLKVPEDDSSLCVAQLALQAISANKQLWERYLADFARVKLQCYLGRHGSQEHRLLGAWLNVLETYSAEKRFVVLHITARLRQKRISLAVAALRPLELLEDLHPDIKPSNVRLLTQSGQGQELEGQLYTYIISVLHGYLENMLSTTYSSEQQPSFFEDSFMKWCGVYQNLSASLPAMRLYQSHNLYVRSKLQAIHIVFLFMRALNLDRSFCSAAKNLAQEVIHTCNAHDESIRQFSPEVWSLPLSSVIESSLSCLCQAYGIKTGETPGPEVVDAFLNSGGTFVEDVLAFYFPKLRRGFRLFSSSPDCSWLMNMINSQNHWCVEAVKEATERFKLLRRSLSRKESVTACDHFPVGLVHFKIVQDSLTQVLQVDFDTDCRTGFSSAIRQMVGEVLCKGSTREEIKPFIPTYYPNYSMSTNSCMHQPLASVYFHCCLKQLNTKHANAGLPFVLKLIRQYDSEIQSVAIPTLAVLQVERQAVTQVFIKQFSEMFKPGNVELLKSYLTDIVIRQVNHLFEDESYGGGGKCSGHILAFLHHLSQSLMSTRRLINIFTDHYRSLCSPFPWMQGLVHSLKEKPVVQYQLFPFKLNEETFEPLLYNKVSRLVAEIAQAALRRSEKDESEAVDALCEFCKSESCRDEGKILHLGMMLWLAVYDQLYERKVQSNHLAEAVHKKLDCIGLTVHQGHLLACFAVPQKMVRCCEPLSPINHNEVRHESHTSNIRRSAQSGDRDTADTDPVWNLFDPVRIEKQDPSDIDLRRTLALLAAVVMGLPAGSTHLWTHVFEPHAMERTYVTGNMYRNVVSPGRLLYDCGYNLTADGEYRWARTAQAHRGALNLHSLHLLLWVNFGAFCLSLLTQPGAQDVIKGHFISELESVRHYCLSQLQTMWLLMRNSMKFSDEETTFFVITALNKFFEVAQRTNSPLRGAVFNNPKDLDQYERAFHVEVYLPTLQMFENKTAIDDTLWRQHPLLTSIRTFSATYPVEPTYSDFLHSLEHFQGPGHSEISQPLSVLCKFVRERQLFRTGGLLLPDLVEFYLWLHQQLSHLMTMEQALSLSVSDVVNRLTNRYSKSYADYIQRLFARVRENYNKYVEMSGGFIGEGAGSRNKILPINPKKTKLFQLLSDTEEEGEGPDALFTVIRTLVTAQNDFVQAVTIDAQTSNFLPIDQGEVSAFELGWHNCLMGDITRDELQSYRNKEVECLGDDPGVELMNSIRRHHLYVPGAGATEDNRMVTDDLTASVLARYSFKASTMFEFHRLQKDVVTQFISGKPIISNPALIRAVFRYRKEQILSSSAEACIDLPGLEQELPNEFKSELSPAQRKQLYIVFHNLNYCDSIDLMKVLRAVSGHLCQAIMEARETDNHAISQKCEELARLSVEDFLLKVYTETEWSPELGVRIGLPRLADRQREQLLRISLSQLYGTLDTFASKLCNHEYEFARLPLTLKTPLPEACKEAINKLPAAYSDKGLNQTSTIVKELMLFDKTLLHSERFLEQEAKKSLHVYLVENTFYDATDLPVCCLPEDIRVEHYMHMRLAIQRVASEVRAKAGGMVSIDETDSRQWSDVVTSLVDKFSQLDHRPRSESAVLSRQLPVFVLDEKGGLYHPSWCDQATKKEDKQEEHFGFEIDDDDSEGEGNEFRPVREKVLFSIAEEPGFGNNADLTLPPINELSQPNRHLQLSISNTMEESGDSFETLETSESFSCCAWENIQHVEENIGDGVGMPILQQMNGDQMQTQGQEVPVLSPLSGKVDVSRFLEMCSPDEKQNLQRQLLRESGKDLSFMSVDEVAQLLESHGFGQYVGYLKDNDIDGGVLQELDVDGFKAMGVTPVDAAKLVKFVRQEKKK